LDEKRSLQNQRRTIREPSRPGRSDFCDAILLGRGQRAALGCFASEVGEVSLSNDSQLKIIITFGENAMDFLPIL
jgi:hypothetical protein